MKKISLTLLATLLVVAIACKKTKKEEPVEEPQTSTPTTGSVSANKTSYKPFEIVEITCNNLQLNDTLYTCNLNGTVFKAKRYNSKLYAIMPNINSGSYVLNVDISSATYTAAVSLLPQASIADPQVYFQNEITSLQNSIQSGQSTLNSLSTVTVISSNPEHQQNLNNLSTFINNLNQSFNALSASDKDMVVHMLDANKQIMNDLKSAVNGMNFAAPSYMKTIAFSFNPEGWFKSRINENGILAVVTGAVASGIITYGAVGLLAAAAAPAAGIIVGAMVANYGMEIWAANVSNELTTNSANRAGNPQSNLKMLAAQVGTVIPNNTEKLLSISADYRSLYSTDASSTYTSVSKYNTDLSTMHDNHFKIMSYAPSLNVASPKKLSQISTYKTYNLSVHSDYINISDISNPDVSLVSVNKVNGDVYVKFSTQKTTDQAFSFKINYSSPTGQFTHTMNAKLTTTTFPPCFFQATGSGPTPYMFQWDTGHTNDTMTVNPSVTTIYQCTITNGASQSSVQSFTCFR